jgi:hypothetical protein
MQFLKHRCYIREWLSVDFYCLWSDPTTRKTLPHGNYDNWHLILLINQYIPWNLSNSMSNCFDVNVIVVVYRFPAHSAMVWEHTKVTHSCNCIYACSRFEQDRKITFSISCISYSSNSGLPSLSCAFISLCIPPDVLEELCEILHKYRYPTIYSP